MTEGQFWGIIKRSRYGIEAVKTYDEMEELQIGQLRDALLPLPPEEVQAFELWFDGFLGDAHRWDLWGVADLLNGWVSDDGFNYFLCWLVAQGEAVYKDTLRDPDSLVDAFPKEWDGGNAELEMIWYLPGQVYREKTGTEINDAPPLPEALRPRFESDPTDCTPSGEPRGERWQVEDLPKRFPKTWAKFGWNEEI